MKLQAICLEILTNFKCSDSDCYQTKFLLNGIWTKCTYLQCTLSRDKSWSANELKPADQLVNGGNFVKMDQCAVHTEQRQKLICRWAKASSRSNRKHTLQSLFRVASPRLLPWYGSSAVLPTICFAHYFPDDLLWFRVAYGKPYCTAKRILERLGTQTFSLFVKIW